MAALKRLMIHLFHLIVLTLLAARRSDSANTTVTTRLYRELLNKTTYEKAVRPSNGSDLPLLIQCGFVPILHHVDIINQEIELRARMVMTWVDNRLAWNPDDYDGVSQLQVPVTEIWKPHLNMYERISKHSDQSFQTETEGATINPTGEISWVTMATTRSFCLMDMKEFPYDSHTCNLTFTTFMYQETQVQLIHNKDLLSNYTYEDYEIHHEAWDMDFAENDPEKPGYIECSYCLHAYANLSYLVTLKRVNPKIARLTFALPCSFLACLSSVVAVFQGGSKEVPGFCLTCVLALTVFLMALYNMLPGTGFCDLGRLIVAFIVTGSCDTGVAVLMLKMPEQSFRKTFQRWRKERKQDKKTKGKSYIEGNTRNRETGKEVQQKEKDTDPSASYNHGSEPSGYGSTGRTEEFDLKENQKKNNDPSDGSERESTLTGENLQVDDEQETLVKTSQETDYQQTKKIIMKKELILCILWFVLLIIKVSSALSYFT